MISEAFEALENVHKIGTRIHSFKEYLVSYIKGDEEFYVKFVSTFMAKVASFTDEARRKQLLPSNFIIK